MTRSIRACLIVCCWSFVFGAACTSPRRSNENAARSSAVGQNADEWFHDGARDAGLNFAHFNGMSGGLYDPETIGPGAALLDFDNDGDLDVLLVQGEMLGARKTLRDALLPPASDVPLVTRLFRNDLEVLPDGSRHVRFTDVTERSGLTARGYGMGVATGDFNNDGCVDLYLTKFGSNQLFRNNCDGTFTDVTRESGTSDSGWSVSATFFDYDRDGWLDLFVGHYLAYTTDLATRCFSVAGIPDYCSPSVRSPQPNRLFHNNGNGTFTDVTAKAGLATEFGGALGVVSADFNRDGWPDLYVTDDGRQNQLWINQKNGTFKNLAVISGAALSADGAAKASMGVDADDFDNDGDDDLIMTELSGQGSNLFVNDGSALFEERSTPTAIHRATLPYTGFGVRWIDFDNDGWLDLLFANGLVFHDPERLKEPFQMQQRMQLLRNVGGRFEDVTAQAGSVFTRELIGRGAAFGDIDNDGDLDVLIANDNGPPLLLINAVGNRNHWIGLRLTGTAKGRDMLGARVQLDLADGSHRWRRAHSDGSFAAASDPRVLVGLGSNTAAVAAVRVFWPDGRAEQWTQVPIDRYTTLAQGTGK